MSCAVLCCAVLRCCAAALSDEAVCAASALCGGTSVQRAHKGLRAAQVNEARHLLTSQALLALPLPSQPFGRAP